MNDEQTKVISMLKAQDAEYQASTNNLLRTYHDPAAGYGAGMTRSHVIDDILARLEKLEGKGGIDV